MKRTIFIMSHYLFILNGNLIWKWLQSTLYWLNNTCKKYFLNLMTLSQMNLASLKQISVMYLRNICSAQQTILHLFPVLKTFNAGSTLCSSRKIRLLRSARFCSFCKVNCLFIFLICNRPLMKTSILKCVPHISSTIYFDYMASIRFS